MPTQRLIQVLFDELPRRTQEQLRDTGIGASEIAKWLNNGAGPAVVPRGAVGQRIRDERALQPCRLVVERDGTKQICAGVIGCGLILALQALESRDVMYNRRRKQVI